MANVEFKNSSEGRRNIFSVHGVRVTRYPYGGKSELDLPPYLKSYKKINSNKIVGLNIKGKKK